MGKRLLEEVLGFIQDLIKSLFWRKFSIQKLQKCTANLRVLWTSLPRKCRRERSPGRPSPNSTLASPPKGEWTSSDEGKTNGFDKFKNGATTDNLPPGVLYKVKATYKYQAEDMDELQFEVGEIIDVIEYE